jgi:indolepyruvate ferredoxin oxidoreductase alpha subunit
MIEGTQGTRKLLLGNEAIARGAVEGGVAAIAAYPGTPSTEIGDTLRAEADDFEYYMEYSINEKTALETAISASQSGLRSMAIMKHVGINVAADSLMSLARSGVRGGFVLTVADDPNMWSSQNEQDSRQYARFVRMPMLTPTSPQEAKEMAAYAFELSEELGLPVALRSTTRVSHSRAPVDFDEVPEVDTEGDFEKDPERLVHIPAHGRQLKPKLLEKIEAARERMEDLPFTWVEEAGDGEVGVITPGMAYNYVRESLDWMDVDADLLKLGTPYPLPEAQVRAFLESHDRVLIVEELDPVVEEAVRVLVQRHDIDVEISGKYDEVVPMPYELTTERVTKSLVEYFDVDAPFDFEAQKEAKAAADGNLIGRPPQFCPGCPHEETFDAIKTVLGDDAIYAGDIGCYTLGVNKGALDIQFSMGAGSGFAAGLAQFNDEPVLATIGDSTFYHTGVPGLLNAVYNDADTTLVVLDNRTTAMTGQQPNPSTGWDAVEEETDPMPIEDIARAAGAPFVEVVNPYRSDTIEDTIEEAVATEGTSVVVARAPCVLFNEEYGQQLEEIET